ncbi:hypothetical protein ACFU8Q_15150 [Streptomyces sp. NPDC057543]|uniref:hypothetical protein n=1 Tax=Streptomyces sp. NPDC057543 TaxID=3346163 RepID=UPI0036974E5D
MPNQGRGGQIRQKHPGGQRARKDGTVTVSFGPACRYSGNSVLVGATGDLD